jgi:Arc/MetJ-type ribon-helix-helix transcriptional regulator
MGFEDCSARLCIAKWYANRMAQLVARLDDDLMAEVDRLVAYGVVATRSEAVRLGLERLDDQQQRQRVGAAIVDAYRLQPQTDEELAGLDEATRALVNEEPW